MKSRSIRATLLPALVLFAGVSIPLWARSDRPFTNNGPILTAREANALVVTAKTPKEHRMLAMYFNQEAGQYEANAKEHEEMIEVYRKTPTPVATESLGGVRTIEHCASLAKSDREMARVLREMAAAHEEMATKASKK